MSGKTPATADDNHQSWTTFVFNLLLSIAGPVFVATLIVAASIVLDLLMFGGALLHVLHAPPPTPLRIFLYLVVGMAVAVVVEVIASKTVNINRFSLHAVYRNRLVRGYLGAARQARNPDRFTDFDAEDNIRVHTLWPPKTSSDRRNTFGLFHVLNLSLNVVESKRLAWQERKAEPFTVSPLALRERAPGLSLKRRVRRPPEGQVPPPGHFPWHGDGDFLRRCQSEHGLLFFAFDRVVARVLQCSPRLVVGEPRPARGQFYTTEGPDFAIKPLIDEAFGLTTDDKPYVYLSDGGHFEDLGLYEMVRRRCRFIVVIDAGEDANFAFEDLGNAIRKIYIDLGIRIDFAGLRDLRNRPLRAGSVSSNTCPYHAIGVIDYKAVDGDGDAAAMERFSTSNRPCIGPSPLGLRAMRAPIRLFPTRRRLISGSLNFSLRVTARSDLRSQTRS